MPIEEERRGEGGRGEGGGGGKEEGRGRDEQSAVREYISECYYVFSSIHKYPMHQR